MNVFFDVQGTLVCGGIPRPHAREVFAELASAGHDVYLWSSAGAGYASSAAELLGVEDLVFGCYSKFTPPPVTVDYAVDDLPDLVERHGGYTITPFDGDPKDRELWRVAEALGRTPGSS
jgi:phosphoglycolate phosphatase-like HAD superfamily hydrolase